MTSRWYVAWAPMWADVLMSVERGAMGNLIFLHERVLAALMPAILDMGGRLAEQAVQVGQMYARAAVERLAVVDELKQAADARLEALEATTARLETQSAELEALRSL